MNEPVDSRSIPELISDGLNQLSALFRNEFRLAQVEVSDKVHRAGIGLALLAAGAVFAIATSVTLLLTVAALLAAAGLSVGASVLIATILGGGVTAALAWTGLQRLKAEALLPERALRQLHQDTVAAKEQIK